MWPFSSQEYPTCSPEDVSTRTYHYIIIGGGTAGCVLASRLSEDPNTTVLVLERGPVIDTWASRVPLLSMNYKAATYPSYKWASTALAVAAGVPPLDMMSGKALGGTSRINAQLYTRSVPGEYNAWAEAGWKGWAWKDVEPYFIKSENSLSCRASPHRGTQGPWKNRGVDTLYFESSGASIDAADALGIPCVLEANDPSSPPVVCSRVDLTMDENGRRMSTFDAFLPLELAVRRKDNLHICPGVVVTKLDLQQTESGVRAAGVYFQKDPVKSGAKSGERQYYALARKEIILSAGAIVSPQILMLSGIGPAKHLASHAIEVIKDLPGVGSHLQDHTGVPVIFSAPLGDTMHILEQSKLRAATELLKYLLFGTGLFLCPNPQIYLFTSAKLLDADSQTIFKTPDDSNSHLSKNIPDIEIMHIPCCAWDFAELPQGEGAMSYLCVNLRPESTGTVRLRSTDACDRPDCDLGFLTDERDFLVMRKAVRLGMAMGRKLRENGYPARDLFRPESEADEDLDAFIKKAARSTFHYSSTCRMAPEEDKGVVDDELRVHGIQGLRIADASIFPSIPATHLQAPVVMVAERCVDFIHGNRTQ